MVEHLFSSSTLVSVGRVEALWQREADFHTVSFKASYFKHPPSLNPVSYMCMNSAFKKKSIFRYMHVSTYNVINVIFYFPHLQWSNSWRAAIKPTPGLRLTLDVTQRVGVKLESILTCTLLHFSLLSVLLYLFVFIKYCQLKTHLEAGEVLVQFILGE